MTLPVVVEFHSDETRMSLLSRLAITNGYSSVGEFLALTDTNANAVRSGTPEAIAMLADWSGVEPRLLLSYSIKNLGHYAWRFGLASMNRETRIGRNHRYCPKCVLMDLDQGKGRPYARPYVRATWMTRAIQGCLVHRCQLVEAPAIGPAEGDFSRFVADSVRAIKQEAATVLQVGAMRVDEYVAARIEGKQSNPFLDSLETYVAVDLCRNLGYFKIQHRPDGQKNLTPSDLTAVETGFLDASQGPQRIEETIASAIERETPPAVEMKAFFGKLRSWLLRNHTKEEFSPVVELFQGIAERYLPIGKDDLFVVPTRRRHLHSVRSASIEYNLMEDRVYQLVVEAGLTQPSELTSGRVYFNAEKGHEVLSAALDTMTARDLANTMGVTLERTRAILAADLIPRVEKFSNNNARTYSRICPADFEAFRAKLYAPEASSADLERIKSLTKVAKLARCTIEEIIALAVDGKLTSLRRVHSNSLINGLGVDPAEVLLHINAKRHATAQEAGKRTSETPGLIGVTRATELLKTRSQTVSKLVRLGYLNLVEGFNPLTRSRQAYVCAQSLETFNVNYVSLAELSSRSKVFRGNLRKSLETRGIKPIFEVTGGDSRYYRIEDVRHITG
ncbi:TniQ family protein [Ensifer sp. Root127]|uniref:TniQ family protein n=1 Tax=Ensifer sp. Root127 TaxID=1736440 RepID=UPI00070D3CC2|nr:TniQ family protein [Ensifer sp. Root127]KQW82057.1 hypothetical protein ASD03_23350 [Ensifer sp. Root127]